MTLAGQLLALEVSAGAGGFLVVLLLGLAAVGLFVMMPRSLARMRGNIASGRFGDRATDRNKPAGGQGSDTGIPPQHSPRHDQ
ncbi:hypothetical protein [Candidatus Protofrankia californiensis]|uniref:hypothetical protein n=1 Tax=Candidatus Protofrankia californiensis TaxID=1839754 RepID=UPI0010419E00|nr:hypothetical protein [Candidatus Protofrankia californiensis]